MVGKRAALMAAMANQTLRFVEGVRAEGGIRRVAFEFPDEPVVVVVMRKSEYEEIGTPSTGKGRHKYQPQQMVHEVCGWCLQLEEHPNHGANLPL